MLVVEGKDFVGEIILNEDEKGLSARTPLDEMVILRVAEHGVELLDKHLYMLAGSGIVYASDGERIVALHDFL